MGINKSFDYVFRLIRFAFQLNPLFYLSIFISLFSVVVELMAMMILLPIFQSISDGNDVKTGVVPRVFAEMGYSLGTREYLWIFTILIALRIITQLIGQSLSINLGRRVMAQLGSGAFEQIIHKLAIREINEKSIGFYISLAGDESHRASTLVLTLNQFASTAFLAILYFGAIVKYSPIAGVFLIIFSLCSLIVVNKGASVSHQLGDKQTDESRRLNSLFLDSVNNLKTVRAFSAEKYVSNAYSYLLFRYAKTLFSIDFIVLAAKLLPVLFLIVFFCLWMAYIAPTLERNDIAYIVTMIVYLMRFFPTVGQGINLFMKMSSEAKSGKDVTTIISKKSSRIDISKYFLESVQQIKYSNVSFFYNNFSTKKILNNIDLIFERNNSYALIGSSGVGKSTLVDLLLKFYTPISGNIYINNQSLYDISESEIRKKIIFVGQDSAIFDDTLLNNICLGIDAYLSEVHAVCSTTCIHKVIEEMSEGYTTRLQYQGKNLSGGQRQRIAIARALLRKPDVLILDESTSALDKTTQTQVVENILEEYSNKIVIFVTHDPYIINRVDKVIDLNEINFINNESSFADSVIG